jgi:hypothetical protein
MNRRDVLRKLGQVALVPAAVAAASEASAAGTLPLVGLPGAQFVNVYRLAPVPRGQKARRSICCNACHLHSQNRFYATPEAADQDRPHIGCNCAIVVERISPALFDKMFPSVLVLGGRRRRLVFDQRWA